MEATINNQSVPAVSAVSSSITEAVSHDHTKGFYSTIRAKGKEQGLKGKDLTTYINTQLALQGGVQTVTLADGSEFVLRKDRVTKNGLFKFTGGLASREGLKLLGKSIPMSEEEAARIEQMKLEKKIQAVKARLQALELKRA